MRKTLEITTKISRCLDCSFCPQAKLNSAYTDPEKILTLENFKTVLEKLDAPTEIHFSGFSEPFLNPQCGAMIKLASDKGFPVHIYSTLIGMTNEQASLLGDSKIAVFRIHVPDGKHLVVNVDSWFTQLSKFLALKIPFTAMAMGEIQDSNMFRRLDAMGILVELPEMLSRAGNLWNPNSANRKFKSCSMDRWHSNVMLPNGDVVGDCHDYALSVRLGNLIHQPYVEIFKAAEDWKNSDHSSDICSRCEWSRYH